MGTALAASCSDAAFNSATSLVSLLRSWSSRSCATDARWLQMHQRPNMRDSCETRQRTSATHDQCARQRERIASERHTSTSRPTQAMQRRWAMYSTARCTCIAKRFSACCIVAISTPCCARCSAISTLCASRIFDNASSCLCLVDNASSRVASIACDCCNLSSYDCSSCAEDAARSVTQWARTQ